jgi:hypothetical protein
MNEILPLSNIVITEYIKLKARATSRSIACKGLQNLGLCSALRAFEQEGVFIMPHLP